jgi:Zn-finger nucleic acid-binding protein
MGPQSTKTCMLCPIDMNGCYLRPAFGLRARVLCDKKSRSAIAHDDLANHPTHIRSNGMFCPVCKRVELFMTDRQGIEIDCCPTCRGVWLDRGELDKLIERSIQHVSAGTVVPAPVEVQSRGNDSHQGFKDSDFGHKDHGHGQQGQHGQRRSFLRDLFD